jgi:dihydroorotate dehydrogenase
MIFPLLRPALFLFEGERAHRLTIDGLKLMPHVGPPRAGALVSEVAGIRFPNPLGMAPGFDKDAEVPDAVLGLGFGFTEIGTVTPRPQPGNPQPRLFRLQEDRAVINRLGFNNNGHVAARARLERRQRRGIVGVNVGANKDSADRIGDYIAGIRTFRDLADYMTINISSPNTPGLRDLQGDSELSDLLSAVAAEREPGDPPVFLKVAPDLDEAAPARIVETATRYGIAAIIVANTTITRPSGPQALKSRYAGEAGGLSGAPLRDLAQQKLRDFHGVAKGAIPLIGVGGIGSAEDAWARIRAGASLVQLYSAMVYEGPGLARRITSGLERLMKRDGFASIAEAVGSAE